MKESCPDISNKQVISNVKRPKRKKAGNQIADWILPRWQLTATRNDTWHWPLKKLKENEVEMGTNPMPKIRTIKQSPLWNWKISPHPLHLTPFLYCICLRWRGKWYALHSHKHIFFSWNVQDSYLSSMYVGLVLIHEWWTFFFIKLKNMKKSLQDVWCGLGIYVGFSRCEKPRIYFPQKNVNEMHWWKNKPKTLIFKVTFFNIQRKKKFFNYMCFLRPRN